MKKIVTVVIAIMLVVVVQADFIVDVSATFGFYNQDGLGGGIIGGPVGGTATVELLYVGVNGVIDYEVGGTDIFAGGSGDDVLLGSFAVINNNLALFEDFAYFSPVNIVAGGTGGEIFARIYWDQDPSVGGAWYYQGHLSTADNLDPAGVPAPLPNPYNLGQGLDSQVANMGQVIPEPATLGMMAVAGLGMFLARKKARR